MGRYGVDRPRVLELLKLGWQSGRIAEELGCASSTITGIKREFRTLGVTWDGDEGDEQLDELDVSDDSSQPIGWPGAKPPPEVIADPEILAARKDTAIKQAKLADMKIDRELSRIQLEMDGKPVPNQGVDFQRELLAALIAQQVKPPPPSMFTPQVVSTLITAAVGMIQAFKAPPVDHLKMLSEFQKIVQTHSGVGDDAPVADDNMLGTVMRALAATKAPPAMGAAPVQQVQQPQPQIDERQKRNMTFLGMIAKECRLGSDPSAIAAALGEGLGMLPEEFRKMLLEENLTTILGALPTLVPLQVAEDFQALANDPRHRQWLETFLTRIRERNRLGGVLDEGEETQRAPEPYQMFPQGDPAHQVVLPPNGPQLPPTAD